MNSVTHGIAGIEYCGVGLCFSCVRVVTPQVSHRYYLWRFVTTALASTIPRAIPVSINGIPRFRPAIYLLIAGTYTPFLLARCVVRGLGLLAFSIARIACCSRLFNGRFDRIPALYVRGGLFWWNQADIMCIPYGALIMMAIGGLAYTFGVFLCTIGSLSIAIWHCFVMAEAPSISVILYVLDKGG